MKRVISIIFLLLFLYNLAGYYLIFVWKQYQAKMEMNAFLDKNELEIPPKDLIIKFPLMLPYQMNRIDFEVAKGSFIHEGKNYEKVRQIILRDTLYIYCIENVQQAELQKELTEHTQRHIANTARTPNPKTSKISFNFLGEYLALKRVNVQRIDFLMYVWDFNTFQDKCYERNPTIPSPPPKTVNLLV